MDPQNSITRKKINKNTFLKTLHRVSISSTLSPSESLAELQLLNHNVS